MDEYLGVDLQDTTSQYFFLAQSLVSKLPFKEVLCFDSHTVANPDLYEQRLKDIGGVDVAVHGIGVNGHLAFNEPGSPHNSRTRIVELTESTRIANSRFFTSLEAVPRLAITVGLETIMEARKNYLIAFGHTKRNAITAAIEGPISVTTPASILQHHSNTVYLLDEQSQMVCPEASNPTSVPMHWRKTGNDMQEHIKFA